jgi:signal transduction histidine kinase
MQQGLLFHTLYEPEGGAYVIQLNYELVGLLDVAALKGAWERVIARHAALRTAIVWEGLDQPVQVVRRRVELPIVEHDWCGWSVERQQRQHTEFLEEARRRGFELGQAPLMRLSLVRLGEHRYYLTWSFHHIVLDGWCRPIIDKEVQRCTNIVDGLLDFSRPKGKTKQRTRIMNLVEDTLFLLRHHKSYRKLEVRLDVDPTVPDIHANAEQLIQAFERSFGADAGAALTLVCSERGFLSEIRIALRASALEGDLDRGDLYLNGPTPDSRCPGTLRIDAAGP